MVQLGSVSTKLQQRQNREIFVEVSIRNIELLKLGIKRRITPVEAHNIFIPAKFAQHIFVFFIIIV